MIKFTNRYFSAPSQLSFLVEKAKEALEKEAFIGGRYVEDLENALGAYYDAKGCVSCGNGTDALELVLSYFSTGTKGLVFCPSYTYIATAEAIVRSGHIPWFVDIDPATLTLSPDNLCENIEAAEQKNHKIAGVITVDIFGNPSKYKRLQEICREKDLFLIADSAQSFGAKYKNGSWIDYVDASSFSFYPTKPLGGIGDGGALITNSPDIHHFLAAISRHQARKNKHNRIICGRNSRLDSMNAQVLSAKLAVLDAEIHGRVEFAMSLRQNLSDAVRLQEVEQDAVSSWCNITLIFKNMADVRLLEQRMKERAIETRCYYEKLTHEYGEFLDYPIDIKGLKHSEHASKLGISIPAHGALSEKEMMLYFDALAPFLKK